MVVSRVSCSCPTAAVDGGGGGTFRGLFGTFCEDELWGVFETVGGVCPEFNPRTLVHTNESSILGLFFILAETGEIPEDGCCKLDVDGRVPVLLMLLASLLLPGDLLRFSLLLVLFGEPLLLLLFRPLPPVFFFFFFLLLTFPLFDFLAAIRREL